MSTLSLQILSQEKLLFSGDVSVVYVPAKEGMMGVLPHHIPFIGQLKKGHIKVLISMEEKIFSIEGGFIHVEKQKTSILVY